MSLREEWYAAQVQRQQEVRERQQQVLEYRQQIQAQMAALHQYQRTMLNNFHSTLQADVATFLDQTRCSGREPPKAIASATSLARTATPKSSRRLRSSAARLCLGDNAHSRK